MEVASVGQFHVFKSKDTYRDHRLTPTHIVINSQELGR